jgi:hypothetical protein
MQQRQLRLGDILDDYCPRERRLTNHAIVAMVGPDIKQTRCTTCDAEHEYKHARVPRQRKKTEAPAALYAPVQPSGPKRREQTAAPAADESSSSAPGDESSSTAPMEEVERVAALEADQIDPGDVVTEAGTGEDHAGDVREDGPVHRPLIRASLPRPEGQPAPPRPVPDFTIRHPGTRSGRFRPRPGRGPHMHGNRGKSHAGGPPRPGVTRQDGLPHRLSRRSGHGRHKRSK